MNGPVFDRTDGGFLRCRAGRSTETAEQLIEFSRDRRARFVPGVSEQHRPESFPYAYQQSEISRRELGITSYDS